MSIPQIYAAGIFDSDIAFTSQVGVTKERLVRYYELEFYQEDCGISYTSGVEYPIKKNTVLFARPGETRHSVLPMKSHYVRFFTDDEYILGMLDNLPTVFTSANVDEYVGLVREMISMQNDTSRTREAMLASVFLALVAKIYDESRIISRLKNDTMPQNSLAVTEAKAYIEQNYASECNLADVSAHVNFSPIYFHKIFKTATKKTPYQYLNEVRINHAKHLLLTDEAPLSEIGERCGFSSQQYFNYAFKKHTGMTPTQYKISMQEKYFPKE